MAATLKISRPVPSNAPWLQPLTPWQKFRRDPAKFIAHWLYSHQPIIQDFTSNENCSDSAITIVCISDTHGTLPAVPDGDILLHAGDLTNTGSFNELQSQLTWISSLPHKHKIVIGGNHDSLLDPAYIAQFPERIHEGVGTSRADLNWGNIEYLCNSTVELSINGRTITIYGSPWTPQCGSFAFQYPPIRQVWTDKIPHGTDIVLTHGPPMGHLDLEGKGCPQLLDEIKRVQPRLVVFGHIHAARGRDVINYNRFSYHYDGVSKGMSGFRAVVLMAISTITRRACLKIKSKPADNSKATLLVNAAVVGGLQNHETYPGTVVHI